MLTPIIDGRSLVELATEYEEARNWEDAGIHEGLVLGRVEFDQLPSYFLGRRWWPYDADRTAVLGCTCGVTECGPFHAEIQVSDDRVTWTRFRNPAARELDWDYSELGPFTFDSVRGGNPGRSGRRSSVWLGRELTPSRRTGTPAVPFPFVPRAKIWLDSTQHMDNQSRWERVTVGRRISVGVIYGGGELHVNEMWSGTGKTTVGGRVVGIEWHAITGGERGPGVAAESIRVDVPEADDYVFELTVATTDWLPH